jgi:hypothetical protein
VRFLRRPVGLVAGRGKAPVSLCHNCDAERTDARDVAPQQVQFPLRFSERALSPIDGAWLNTAPKTFLEEFRQMTRSLVAVSLMVLALAACSKSEAPPAVQKAVETTKEAAKEAADATAKAAGQAADATTKAASEAVDATKQAAGQAVDATKQAIAEGKEATAKATEEAKQAAVQSYDAAKEGAAKAVQEAKDAAAPKK